MKTDYYFVHANALVRKSFPRTKRGLEEAKRFSLRVNAPVYLRVNGFNKLIES